MTVTTPDPKQPNYLSAFFHADQALPHVFTLTGEVLLVKEIKAKEMKSKGGIIIPTTHLGSVDGIEANRPCWVEVMKVGAGHETTAGEDCNIPLETEPGWVLLVPKLSVKWLSTLGSLNSTSEHNFGLVLESEAQAIFKSRAEYDLYFQTLEKHLA